LDEEFNFDDTASRILRRPKIPLKKLKIKKDMRRNTPG
jgi:hypothetical protein